MAALYTLKAARALAAVPDAHKTRFVVGSQCLREENQARDAGRRSLPCCGAAAGGARATAGASLSPGTRRRALTRRARAQVHLLEYDEESNSLRAQLYGHKHELWHLAPSPTNPALLATCYSDGTGARPRLRARRARALTADRAACVDTAGKGHRASLWRYPASAVPREGCALRRRERPGPV